MIGASYVALESAGFLNGLGYDVTVLVRSKVLPNFDQDFSKKVKAFMIKHGIKFIDEGVASSITLTDNKKNV